MKTDYYQSYKLIDYPKFDVDQPTLIRKTRKPRGIREDCEGKCSKKGIIPLKHRNDTSINWQPLQGTEAKVS